GRIDRRAARAAEGLHAPATAVRCRLQIFRRFAGHLELRAWHRHRDAERRAGSGLAVGTVADRDLLRIGFALDGDRAAVTRAGDFHDWNPPLVGLPFYRFDIVIR